MAADNEPAKLLLPYLQRADELQKHEPLVAYYCRLYAMEMGLVIPKSERTKTTDSKRSRCGTLFTGFGPVSAAVVVVWLVGGVGTSTEATGDFELDKKFLKLSPDDHLHLEGFALNVFGKADKQDRAGRADLNTAKTFYAASIFFEILNQFGELQPDKQKYAVWKAADIKKALKEGRKPDPGPPAVDDDSSVPSSTSYDLGPSETSATTPRSEFNPSPQFPDGINRQHSARMPSQTHFDDLSNNQHSTNDVPSPAAYPNAGYPSHDFHPPPPASGSDGSAYNQAYHHQSYPQDLPQPSPFGYTSPEASPHSYPNFHSYPSFSVSSLPSVASHYPSYHQGSDSAYAAQTPPPPAASNPSTAQQSAETYHYENNYQPPPEKIAEAQKAARFAVSALGFDEVPVAVEHLKKSLELLTRPSAGH